MKKNDYFEIEITDMNSLGHGVGHFEGKAVFVAGAVTGEKIRAKVIKDGGSYYVARREELLYPSSFRREKSCDAFPSCGGCAFCHIDYEYEKELKKRFVEGFLLKAGVEAEVLPLLSTEQTAGYRNKVQYPVREGKLGYYASHSHRVVEKEGCALHHPAMEPVIRTVADFIKKEQISCYEEESGKGLLRHVYLRTNHDGSEMLLTLIVNGESLPQKDKLLSLLKDKHPSVTGVLLNINKKNTNVILGSDYILLAGSETLTDSLLGCTFEMSPASFYQVNRRGAELLYSKVIEQAELTGDEVVADLFCGIGTIGLCLAKNAGVKELVGIEVIEQAVENAKKNAKRNGIENASFYCADANHPALQKADVVIVDPPRKGLEKELIAHLTALSPKKIVYVSCDPATLARDLALFHKDGWQIGKVQPVDMFPRTGHVESVVSLTRGFDNELRERMN